MPGSTGAIDSARRFFSFVSVGSKLCILLRSGHPLIDGIGAVGSQSFYLYIGMLMCMGRPCTRQAA